MPGSQTTQGRFDTCAGVSDRVAFRVTYRVGTLSKITFAAQWLAYTLPCRRFADTLTDACARLGANVGRYSFIATDSHRLLLAGLPAHKYLIRVDTDLRYSIEVCKDSARRNSMVARRSCPTDERHGVW
jgi:hypothetical protein